MFQQSSAVVSRVLVKYSCVTSCPLVPQCKTYACIMESHLMGLTIDFSMGFVCFDAASKVSVGQSLIPNERREREISSVRYFCIAHNMMKLLVTPQLSTFFFSFALTYSAACAFCGFEHICFDGWFPPSSKPLTPACSSLWPFPPLGEPCSLLRWCTLCGRAGHKRCHIVP